MSNTIWRHYNEIYAAANGHYVVGNVQTAVDVYSPQLQNSRAISVYLPPTYATDNGRYYPVLYMQDGQNLFDPKASYIREWCVDESMEELAHEEQLEAIVVAIANTGHNRLHEYSPFADLRHGGGKGDLYLNFVTETVKPLIDASFRTLRAPGATGIAGSSMGGLISLYAFFHRPDIFGFTGVMSPSLWFADNAIFHYVAQAAYQPGTIYLDAGTREFGDSWQERLTLRAKSRRYYGSVRRMHRLLVRKGYRPIHQVKYVEEKSAGHNEAAWARRFPLMMRHFLEPRDNFQQLTS